jgi:hypothetical protein
MSFRGTLPVFKINLIIEIPVDHAHEELQFFYIKFTAVNSRTCRIFEVFTTRYANM